MILNVTHTHTKHNYIRYNFFLKNLYIYLFLYIYFNKSNFILSQHSFSSSFLFSIYINYLYIFYMTVILYYCSIFRYNIYNIIYIIYTHSIFIIITCVISLNYLLAKQLIVFDLLKIIFIVTYVYVIVLNYTNIQTCLINIIICKYYIIFLLNR